MGRLARVVLAGVAHHVTQRGNARQFLLTEDSERAVYRDLLVQGLGQHGVLLLGYCLMSNHVHLVMVPERETSLALALSKRTGAMQATGMLGSGRADMRGRAGFIHARWPPSTYGGRCGMWN